MRKDPSVIDGKPFVLEGTSMLEARDLSMSFPPAGAEGKAVAAVSHIGFRVEGGELVVLAGRNGSGKTVLCRLLAGLLSPTGGEIRYGGIPLESLPGSPARHVGYAFQEARLQAIGERVLDDCMFGPMNVGMGRREAEERAMDALRRCGLEEKRGTFVHALSGGELRRLSIAGILALDPGVVVLDEPFANLDLDGIRATLRVLLALRDGGKGIVVATHEIEKVLAFADRLVILDQGVVREEGLPAEVLGRNLEGYGIRNPLRGGARLAELSWLD
mgnify:CR=1 FL=1